MKLLNLVVENHRSFRDEFHLELTHPRFTSNIPNSGDSWAENVFPVIAIYGANASGKTTVIDALKYLWSALSASSGEWLNRASVPHAPFLLSEAREQPSAYSIDFTLDADYSQANPTPGETRFHYEFDVTPQGFRHELLQVYRSSRATTLLSREQSEDGVKLKLAAGLGGKFEVTHRELALSRAGMTGRGQLGAIAQKIKDGLLIIGVDDDERNLRLHRITEELDKGNIHLDDFSALAQVSDFGIQKIDVDIQKLPDVIAERLRTIMDALESDAPEHVASTELPKREHSEKETHELIQRSLQVTHKTIHSDAPQPKFGINDQSSGTLAWLALAIPMVEVLRHGTVLCVDELSSSLHPKLAAEIVRVFQTQELNPHHAQLIFSTHDVSLLMPQAELNLQPGQIWFTEKEIDGASELYSLRDFPDIRGGTNIAKQFLEDRYGATPRVIPELISKIALHGAHEGTGALV